MGGASGDWLLPGAQKDGVSITKEWQPVATDVIDGVETRMVRPVLTGYGHLCEILRGEWLSGQAQVDQVFASTFQPGGLSAWHAHATTTDRLFVVAGQMRIVLFDARQDSSSYGKVNEFLLGEQRPMLLIVPPRVWHGVQNYCATSAVLINAVDLAYQYDAPDHWRLPSDADAIPYRFKAGLRDSAPG